MGAQVVDYRVSTLVVLCKDCGQDVGLYPSRHKCQTNVSLPPVPSIPSRYTESNESLQVPRKSVHSPETSSSNGSYSRPTSAASSSSFSSTSTPNYSDSTSTSSPASGKWSRFGQRSKQTEDQQQQLDDDSIYFNNFAAHLPEEERQGRKLWGKVRQNEKWKQMTEKNETQKPTGKLWGKLLSATQNISDKMPSRDEKGPESDDSDWEGESHVSRVLREHYEKKRHPLPNWLRDGRTPSAARYREPAQDQRSYNNHSNSRMNHDPVSQQDDTTKTSTRRRLWDHSHEPSNRERERQELRQQPPPEDNFGNTQRQRQYRSHHRDDHDHYDTPPVSSSPSPSSHQSLRTRQGYGDHGRGYDSNNSGAMADNDYRSYRDQQQPTSYRTNARISQGDTKMDQQRRYRMHDTSPGYYDDRRSGYDNDMEDHYQSSRQRNQERIRGTRDSPSRPNRYLDTNADYF